MASDEEENEVVESEPVEAEPAALPEETAETRSSEARRKVREQMQAEIDAFLNSGGRIEKLEPSSSAQGTVLTAGVNDLSQ